MTRAGAGARAAARARRPFRRPRGVLQWATAAYLALLPLGMGFVFPRAGAIATVTDGLLAVLLAVAVGVGIVGLLRRGASGRKPIGGTPVSPEAAVALALLLAFGGWAVLSTTWSGVPDYAVVKGAGYVALAAGAAVIGWSGLGWRRAMDAWLVGTGLAVAVGVGVALSGPDAWADRMTFQGGSVRGLPFPRLRGPFVHPNGFGDYLVLSGVFLWARWPAWVAGPAPDGSRREGVAWSRWAAYSGVAALLAATILTASTAHLALGVLLLAWGRRRARDAKRGAGGPGASLRAILLRGAGAAVAGIVLAGLLVPLRVSVAGLRITTSAVRPRIWASALEAVATAPLVGVGSTPHVAEAVDPFSAASGPVPWDAHNLYLSVLGQFGVVGFALLAAAIWFLVRHLRRASPSRDGPDLAVVSGRSRSGLAPPVLRHRARLGLLATLLAMGVHGLAIAGEDLRHWWAVAGIAAMGVAVGDPPTRPSE